MAAKSICSNLLLILLSLSALANEWVIGIDADMSSVAKAGGQAIEQGAQLAVEEINAAGGLLGKSLRIDVRDHRGNPARGIANLQSLHKTEGLLAVLGGVHTPVTIAELPFIHQAPLIYLDPWAAGTPIVDNGFEPNFVFRLSVRDEWAAQVILNAAKNDGCTRITLVLERTGWGRSNEVSMTKAAQALALDVDGIEWFNWNSTTLAPLIKQLSEANVACIALVANTPEALDMVNAVAQLDKNSRPRIYSHWGIVGGDFSNMVELDTLNAVAIKYLQTISFSQPKTERGAQLKQRFVERYGMQAANNAFNGVVHSYDLVHLLALAVEQAGSGEPNQVQQALEKIPSFNGAMKHYKQPFSKTNHEALTADDYLMLQFNLQGQGE